MKNYINKLWLAALPLAFVACQNEDAVFENTLPAPQGKPIQSLTGVVGNGMSSRAQVVLNNDDLEREQFIWNAGDRFTVYPVNNITSNTNERYPSTATFTIDAGYNEADASAQAGFTTTFEGLSVGDDYVAIYPLRPAESTPIENGAVFLQTDLGRLMESGTPEEWKSYLSDNMYMIARGKLQEGNNELQFKHMTALLRVSYTNNSGKNQQIGCVRVNLMDSYFSRGRRVALDYNGNWNSHICSWNDIYFSNLTVQNGETKDFYFVTFAENYSRSASFYIELQTNNGTVKTAPMPMEVIAANNNGVCSFEAGKRYWFNITQNDKSDLVWDYTTIEVPVGTIENPELIQAIEQRHGFVFNKDNRGFVDVSDLHNYAIIATTRDLWLYNCNLSSVEGIEYFTNLTSFSCDYNQLTSLDLSQNTRLNYLNCNNNELTSLVLPNSDALGSLYCRNNQLTELNFTRVPYRLDCSNNQLTELKLSQPGSGPYVDIIELVCHGNHLESLDITKVGQANMDRIQCGKQTDMLGNPIEMKLNLRLEVDENWYGAQRGMWLRWFNDEMNEGVVVEGINPSLGSGSVDNLGNGGSF